MRRIAVPVGSRPYDVVVGGGALDELSSLLPRGAARAVVVTQPGITCELDLPIPFDVVHIGEGEDTKILSTVEELCTAFAMFKLTREDVVIGFGGGLVTDVAGLSAGLYHRGTAAVHVATSLVGQVDAAIGGKTAVNLRAGRNLAGMFWQPSGVVCDLNLLKSLPERELRSGYGEIVKCALIIGELGILDQDLEEQIVKCIELKAAVVAEDERDVGKRAILNYGHTLAHALEACLLESRSGRALSHGEAVSIGVVFAACLAQCMGRIGMEEVEQHVSAVRRFGLPTAIPPEIERRNLVAYMTRDKKSVSGFTFVLQGPAGVEVVRDVGREVIEEAFSLLETLESKVD